jgi:Tfp pilus assembly protein PilP
MKLMTGILVLGMAVGAASAQNADVIDNTRSTMKSLQQKQQNDSNAALRISGAKPAASATVKPSPSKPAVSKPVTGNSIPATASVQPTIKPVSAPVAKVSVTPKTAKASVKSAKPKSKVAKAGKPRAEHVIAVEDKKNPAEPKKETEKTINLTGRRDPFTSPVTNRSMVGSGCSTGKKCLAIDQINLKGVVKADEGMIAVVVNAMNKAYFLHENDPVFNGYVVKITGDSIIFKETVQDKLGKPFTREVTKKITTPAV